MQDFEIVYDTYFPRVYGFVLSLCRDAVLAEEIAQSAFIKAFKSYCMRPETLSSPAMRTWSPNTPTADNF